MNAAKTAIAAAIEPMRAAAVADARNRTAAFAERMIAVLQAADFDLDVAAPRPKTNISREQYRQQMSVRQFFERITTRDADRNAGLFQRRFDPRYVVVDVAGVQKQIDQAGEEASAGFDAFVAKLETKVGQHDAAEVTENGDLWGRSVVRVRKGETVEFWKTTRIINFSKYCLAFNQYPTRKAK